MRKGRAAGRRSLLLTVFRDEPYTYAFGELRFFVVSCIALGGALRDRASHHAATP
jgi:hypothetical protein